MGYAGLDGGSGHRGQEDWPGQSDMGASGETVLKPGKEQGSAQ
jgi:hypothetical protein